MIKQQKNQSTSSKTTGGSVGNIREWFRRIKSRLSPLSTLPSDFTQGPLPSLLPKTQSNIDSSDSNLKQVFDFTIDVIDKQYRSYVWNDGKVNALVAINAALIAGILLIPRQFDYISPLAFNLLMCGFFFSISSFLVCLVHAIPRMNARIGNETNLRTIIGIKRLTKEGYHAKVKNLDMEEMVRMNCWQISGMSRNNIRSHNLIRVGVCLTIVAVVFLAIAAPIITFSNQNSPNEPGTQQQLISLILPQPGTDSLNIAILTISLESRPSFQMPVITLPSVTDTNNT